MEFSTFLKITIFIEWIWHHFGNIEILVLFWSCFCCKETSISDKKVGKTQKLDTTFSFENKRNLWKIRVPAKLTVLFPVRVTSKLTKPYKIRLFLVSKYFLGLVFGLVFFDNCFCTTFLWHNYVPFRYHLDKCKVCV